MAESRGSAACSCVGVWLPLSPSVPTGRNGCGGHPPPCGGKESTRFAVPSSGKMLCGLRCHELISFPFLIPRDPTASNFVCRLLLGSPTPAGYALPWAHRAPFCRTCIPDSVSTLHTLSCMHSPHHTRVWWFPLLRIRVYMPTCPSGILVCAVKCPCAQGVSCGSHSPGMCTSKSV